MSDNLKFQVQDFWNARSCGEVYASGSDDREFYESHARWRYQLESYIKDFADFSSGQNADVLEIGVGMGADHVEWAKCQPRSLSGIDLTDRAVGHTARRLSVMGLSSNLQTGDAENLGFADESFDIVYSWGVLHHSPNTEKAIDEVFRVLRPGGRAKIMIYHYYSLTGYMLWLRYALFKGRPRTPLSEIYSQYLESPGTRAFTIEQACRLFGRFSRARTEVKLSCGDLLEGATGQRHGGKLLRLARKIWPKSIIRRFFSGHGLYLMIDAEK